MQRNIKVILRISTTVLVGIVVLFALSISAVRLFGLEVYGVLTGSMEPVYPTGSLIYVREINTDKLEVGDVISFRVSQNVIATHRIVELVPDESDPNIIRYRTKGDANDIVDSQLVNKYDIIGKVVFCLPKMGYFMDFVQSPSGIATTIGISVALVLLVFISEIYTASNKSKTRWKNAIARKLLGPDAVPVEAPRSAKRSANHASSPARSSGGRRPAPRYEEDPPRRRSAAPSQRPARSRYEDDHPLRSRYDESSPRRSRYDEDYSRRSNRYEEDYTRRSSRYDAEARRTQRPRYEEDAPRRSRYDEDYSRRSSRYEEAPSSRRSYTSDQSDYVPRRTRRYDYPDD